VYLQVNTADLAAGTCPRQEMFLERLVMIT
jgi:hypothetical protein